MMGWYNDGWHAGNWVVMSVMMLFWVAARWRCHLGGSEIPGRPHVDDFERICDSDATRNPGPAPRVGRDRCRAVRPVATPAGGPGRGLRVTRHTREPLTADSLPGTPGAPGRTRWSSS